MSAAVARPAGARPTSTRPPQARSAGSWCSPRARPSADPSSPRLCAAPAAPLRPQSTGEDKLTVIVTTPVWAHPSRARAGIKERIRSAAASSSTRPEPQARQRSRKPLGVAKEFQDRDFPTLSDLVILEHKDGTRAGRTYGPGGAASSQRRIRPGHGHKPIEPAAKGNTPRPKRPHDRAVERRLLVQVSSNVGSPGPCRNAIASRSNPPVSSRRTRDAARRSPDRELVEIAPERSHPPILSVRHGDKGRGMVQAEHAFQGRVGSS